MKKTLAYLMFVVVCTLALSLSACLKEIELDCSYIIIHTTSIYHSNNKNEYIFEIQKEDDILGNTIIIRVDKDTYNSYQIGDKYCIE